MKRYWKIMSICLVTILVIGTFYIQSSLATDNHVKIEFEKVSGNEDELQDIMLYGDFSLNDPYLRQPLQITNGETINPTNISFSQKITRLGVPYGLEDLVEKHKHFMRSKDLSSNHFFEDDKVVAYAHIKNPNERDFSFELEVLIKTTDEITSIRLDVPQKEDYGWMSVLDVQGINDELKVITRGFHLGSKQQELRVYTFDMNKQQLVSDVVIASIPEVENGWSDVNILNDAYSIQRQKYLLIKSESFENEERDSNGESNVAVNEFIVYDIENNQSKKIVGPNEILASIADSSIIYNSTLFIPSETANGVDVNQYDIENDKWGETLSFGLSDTKDEESSSHTQLMNGKLYTIHSTTSGHTIVIGDLQTGESLYEGTLTVTNQGEEQKDYQLFFHEIESVQ
ncbi:hypothetical protein [Sporosarcina sp. NPDC096371]|uniref:hypothetical protein n=1 Tax=Sporosarcina sp. NPDC096371 TaxID=3364530 RepID=UPI0038110208